MADAPKYYIQIVEGRLFYHYRVMSANGQVLSVSQSYRSVRKSVSKYHCKRAAQRLAAEFGFAVVEGQK